MTFTPENCRRCASASAAPTRPRSTTAFPRHRGQCDQRQRHAHGALCRHAHAAGRAGGRWTGDSRIWRPGGRAAGRADGPGASNRSGCRRPRALRAIERVGPYNHVLKCTPVTQLRVADIGDVPMRSRFSLDQSHEDIEAIYRHIQQAGVIPLSAGGDHSVTLPILRALGRERPLALIHFDAHCDTGGPFDGSRFHHGGPFRQAVLDGCWIPRAPSRSASAARPSTCGSSPTPRA